MQYYTLCYTLLRKATLQHTDCTFDCVEDLFVKIRVVIERLSSVPSSSLDCCCCGVLDHSRYVVAVRFPNSGTLGPVLETMSRMVRVTPRLVPMVLSFS
jgi:hypothetical protein